MDDRPDRAISAAVAVLNDEWRLLSQHWHETESRWDDRVRRRFEAEHWVETDRTASRLMRAAERLENAAREACSD